MLTDGGKAISGELVGSDVEDGSGWDSVDDDDVRDGEVAWEGEGSREGSSSRTVVGKGCCCS
jgi:hypothetical protein